MNRQSPSDFKLPDMKDLLVLGVTGGIASGKSTVAHMLSELGAPIIDFDRIARTVVEPGKPAFKEIVAHFGRQVMGPDGTLDRKRLSDMVFSDPEKRKTLEGMTHPRILDTFMRKVHEMARTHAQGIVQAVIPLLFEVNLIPLVHKILVIYVSPEVQVERLMRRDHISREKAQHILDAQMPIDEKVKQADFIVHNEGAIDQTRDAVKALWQQLKTIQMQAAADWAKVR